MERKGAGMERKGAGAPPGPAREARHAMRVIERRLDRDSTYHDLGLTAYRAST